MASDDRGVASADGTIEWRDEDGALHRSGGPARIFPSGRAGFGIAALIFFALRLPETKDRSLEEISHEVSEAEAQAG